MDRTWQTTLAVVAGIAGFLLFRFSGWSVDTKLAVSVAIAIAAIGYPIGWLVGRYIANDADVDGKGFMTVAVIGAFGFVVPVAGMAMSAVIWQFYKQSEQHRLLYAGLSSLVCILAAGNAVHGATSTTSNFF